MACARPPPANAPQVLIGDIEKLVRSTNDALNGILFDDDRQVVSLIATKRYCENDELSGAIITLTALNSN